MASTLLLAESASTVEKLGQRPLRSGFMFIGQL
jgi:hypothetical protein